MADFLAIKGTIDSIKAARDIAKTAIGLRDTAVLQEKVIAMNDAILSAQSSALDAQQDQATLAKRVDELERQIANMEEWEREKERYDLVQVASGAFAFMLKESERGSAPNHYMCQNCFHDSHLSVLQTENRMPGRAKVLVCQRCGADIYTQGFWQPEHKRGFKK